MGTCPRCNGKGKIKKYYSGYINPNSGEVTSGHYLDEFCDICKGTGRARFINSFPITCNACAGTGKIETPVYKKYPSGKEIKTGTKAETCKYCKGKGNTGQGERWAPEY